MIQGCPMDFIPRDVCSTTTRGESRARGSKSAPREARRAELRLGESGRVRKKGVAPRQTGPAMRSAHRAAPSLFQVGGVEALGPHNVRVVLLQQQLAFEPVPLSLVVTDFMFICGGCIFGIS